MTVIQFPPAKGPLDFDGMGIKIDVEQQRDDFNALFTSVQTALRFCNLGYVDGISGAKRVGAGRCSRAASIDPFTKRSNAALASAMTRGPIGGTRQ
jgi:hypothetical protein